MFGRCHLPGELGCGIMGTFPSLLHVRKRKRAAHDQSLMAAERSWASRWCRAGSEPLDEVLVRDVEETQRPPIARYFAEEGNASPASPRLQRATQLELLRLCSKAPHSATREANLAALAASRQRLLQADGEDLGQEDELADELRAFPRLWRNLAYGSTLVDRHSRVKNAIETPSLLTHTFSLPLHSFVRLRSIITSQCCCAAGAVYFVPVSGE